MRASRLASRVNGAVLSILACGFALVAVLYAGSLARTREALVDAALRREADILYLSIESFMLPGEAPIAARFFDDVAALGSGAELALFRRNGVPAFSDDATIAEVNRNLKLARFSPRGRRPVEPGRPAAPEDPARFALATSLPPETLFFSTSEGGRSFKRVYRPLVNLPKCTTCHGSDHTIRGVIGIRTDVSGEVRAQNLTVLASVGGLSALAMALAAIIGRLLRALVVGPVIAIGRLCGDVAAGDFSGRIDYHRDDEVGSLADTVNGMVKGLRERSELTKYVSLGTIDSLRSGQEPRRVERTLLFSDVRGFTAYTERHGPEAVLAVLNRLLDRQSGIIASHGGDIDKFVGDEVVAVFGGSDAPARACAAAAAIRAAALEESASYDGLRLGIGIATGRVVQGMVGSHRRADFTVLGDAVNVAARLCAAAEGGQILVCAKSAAALMPGAFILTGPLSLSLKGKARAQLVYVLEGETPVVRKGGAA